MTPYELADLLGDIDLISGYEVVSKAQDMLRQQQAEIGCYKIELELHKAMIQDLEKGLESSLNLNKAQAERHGNNEPAAWIIQDKYGRPALSWKGEPISYNAISVEQEDIPLYTHPAKTLTDEEIEKLAYEYNLLDDYPHEFARAILKKASEK